MSPTSLINLTDASSTLSTAAGFSVPLFVTLIGLAAALVGIGIGGMFVSRIARATSGAVRTAVGGRRGGRRSRRR